MENQQVPVMTMSLEKYKEEMNHLSNVNAAVYGMSAGIANLTDTKLASNIAKMGLVGGTQISVAINIIKDPENPGKALVSTVGANGLVYAASVEYGAIAESIAAVIVEAAAAVLGTTVGVGAVAVASIAIVTVASIMGANDLQANLYNAMKTVEDILSQDPIDRTPNPYDIAYNEAVNLGATDPSACASEALIAANFRHSYAVIDGVVESCVDKQKEESEEMMTITMHDPSNIDIYDSELTYPSDTFNDTEIER